MRVQQTRWSLKKILTCSALTGEEGRVGRGVLENKWEGIRLYCFIDGLIKPDSWTSMMLVARKHRFLPCFKKTTHAYKWLS